MKFASLLLIGITLPIVCEAQQEVRLTEVMIVGTYHLSNPGHDLHNVHADDVLTPKRQAEIAHIVDALARFKPNKVAAEWTPDIVSERYPQYLAGTLAPSRNEVVQFGFRLAQTVGAKGMYGIDADGEFPYQELQTYADAHGYAGVLDAQNTVMDSFTARLQSVLDTRGIGAALRLINDPSRLKNDNGFYRSMLRIGSGREQPGANLVSDWYRRNFLICSNLLQHTQPGDRIVVFYGYGHAFLLRQCVEETPGFKLIEANDYLPK